MPGGVSRAPYFSGLSELPGPPFDASSQLIQAEPGMGIQ